MKRSDGSFSIGSEVWPGASKLIEEMGELTQVLGKLIAAHGATDHWDGTDLLDRLYDEIGDVRAALRFFAAANHMDAIRLQDREQEKVPQYVSWHVEGTANQPARCGEGA